MKVAQLQQTLTELARLLAAAGAKQGGELTEFVRSLDPFADKSLTDFVKLAAKGQAPPKAAKASPDELAAEVYAVYDRPAADGATAEAVEGLCGRLAPLTKGQLVSVAERIELVGTGKLTKPKILDQIRHRLRERISTAARREMIDRPLTPG